MFRVIFFDRGGFDASQCPISPFRKLSGFPGLAGSSINQGPLLFDHRENEVFILKRATPLTQNCLCAAMLPQCDRRVTEVGEAHWVSMTIRPPHKYRPSTLNRRHVSHRGAPYVRQQAKSRSETPRDHRDVAGAYRDSERPPARPQPAEYQGIDAAQYDSG